MTQKGVKFLEFIFALNVLNVKLPEFIFTFCALNVTFAEYIFALHILNIKLWRNYQVSYAFSEFFWLCFVSFS